MNPPPDRPRSAPGLTLAALALLAGPVRAGETADYATEIKPVLAARCYACHGALKQNAGLRLDTAALALKGGAAPVIEPGDAGGSELIARVISKDDAERMPPEGEPLKPAEVDALRRWIDAGAKAPEGETPERDPRDHWAFRPPTRPPIPGAGRSRNPIDRFLAAERDRRSLVAAKPADRAAWLRRVSIDLVGLPPTTAQIDAFLVDRSDDAVPKVVDQLLAAPEHAERWARHWMDIWRYSDWWGLGAEVRNSQKHIWHWRDWIIESLADDKGYDQILREMLAADELYPDDLDRLRASGFLARQYFKFNRTSWLDETVEHTAKAMLGLTFNCAKCHDHKYDPISHADYYRMRAIFEPYQVRTEAVPGEADFEKDGIPRAFDCNLDVRTFLHRRGDDRNPDPDRKIVPSVPSFLGPGLPKIEPVTLPETAARPGLRPFVVEAHREGARRRIEEARRGVRSPRWSPLDVAFRPVPLGVALAIVVEEKALAAAEADLGAIEARAAADAARPSNPSRSVVAGAAATAEAFARAAKADEAAARARFALAVASPPKREAALKELASAVASLQKARKAIETAGTSYTPIPGALKTLESNLETEESRRKPFPSTSTGRRSSLARWITDRRNPLTARVAVNHVWARHFSRPLVATVFDFGRKGAPPTHPELLDWLAVELMEHGWSLKHIHRLIVTSDTYQLSSSTAGADPKTVAADPENRFYWRANPTRMEAQVVRDSLLHLAGDLDPRRGGPPVPVADASSRRRSLYFVHSHNEHQMFLSTFDDASVLECYRRTESVVPQQALALENSPLARDAAAKIARRIATICPELSDAGFIREAYRTVLSVEPTDAERATLADALDRLADAARRAGRADPSDQARANLVHALLNLNDFVTVR